jgi:hypothetical protein
MSQSTTALLELRHYYQNQVAQAEYQSAQAKTQIEHIDALLVNGLRQKQETPVPNAGVVSGTPERDVIPAKMPTSSESAATATMLVSQATVKTKISAKGETKKTGVSRGRTQVLSLPKKYMGLSKIDAVAKLLEENSGTVMHIEDIIQALYGKLPRAEHQAERVRMKDVMTRGMKRNLWRKAQGVPSSIVSGEVNSVAITPSPQTSTRKSKVRSVKKTSSSRTQRKSSSNR